jgi:hypothetical protein
MEINNDISANPELQFAQTDLQVAEKTIAALKNGRNIRGKFVSKKDLPAAKKAANKALDSALTRIAKIEQKTVIASAKSKAKAEAEAKKLQRAAEQQTAKAQKEQAAATAKSQRIAEQQIAKAQKEQAAAAARSQKQQDRDAARLAGMVSTSSTATATMDPPKSVEETEKNISNKIGLLESLKAQRQAQGYKSDALEDYIIGTSEQQGVRSTVEDYIRENRDKFNQDDPAGAAAYELMEETVALSEASLDASHEEAKSIYAELNFIRELAKKTQGDQGEIAKKLQEIIAPVEAQLKKKSSFKAFLTEKASDFKKTIPERIASKIPVVGGILGDFLQQKRISREKMERYTGGLQKQISRKGKRGEGLDIGPQKRQGFSDLGGTPAANIPGMLAGTESPQSSPASPQTGTPSTLGELLKEVSQIRKLLQSKFALESDTSDTVELQKRESELEGLGAEKPIKGEAKKGGGMLSSLRNMLGMGGGEGILSRIASGAGSVGTALLGAPSLAMRGLRGAGGLAMRGLRGAGGLAMKGLRGAGGLISKFGGAKSLELFKTTSLYKDTASIGKSVSGVAKGAMNLGKSALGGVANLGKSAIGGVSEAASGVAKGAMNLGKSALGGVANLGKSAIGGVTNIGKSAVSGIANSSVAKGAMNIGKSAVSGVANLGKSVLGGASQAASGVASTGGGFFSNLAAKAGSALSSMNPVKGLSSFIGKNAGKVAKSIVSFPGLGAVISTVMGAVDIASIKSDPELSVDEKKEKIGRSIVGTLGQALGTIGGGALGTLIPVPGIGTLVGTLGGGWVGGKLAEMLADQIGGKGIYDMVASIPGVGSLIEVGGTEDQKTGKEAENAITAAASATGAAAAGEGGASSSTTVEGKVTNPATANTTVGRMVAQATAEQNGLNEARNMPTATGGNTNNTANVQNKISNTTNNFNDDIRIRNNEPTIKQMQAYSIMP